ncbi:MAG TPA: SDR family oxidoreductase [Oscillatoriaceae cyanobacterium M33_DOE_052]|uniref:dTDP-4-dehydrorhamnose reductase n=1 Tax=Planktothricoides sp. SpSt-374 TaxID=2282167 RepID=A0A7C3ZQH7_9CYAN|nr:SDR family oxidoreductase [Oscillatoriaceae cyanobacterium M33_DOE_052]
MKVLIIGASGLVGSHLMVAAQRRNWEVMGTYHNFARPGLIPLRLTDAVGVRQLIREYQPDTIFLPAFRSHVDYCEQHPEETYQVNVAGSVNVAIASGEVGAKLVFYSSDYVFNGRNGPYQETDKPDPICVYGRQKLTVEEKIGRLLADFLILRITVVYGNEAQGKNFVSRLVTTLAEGQVLKVPQDQVGSPTLVDDIAEASCRLVAVNANGIFHVVGPERMSRYQFALEAAKVFGLSGEKILPVTTAELAQAALRPLEAGMVGDKLVQTLNWNLRGVAAGLTYLKQTRVGEYVSI